MEAKKTKGAWLLASEASGVPDPQQVVEEEPVLYQFTLARKDDKWFVTVAERLGPCRPGDRP